MAKVEHKITGKYDLLRARSNIEMLTFQFPDCIRILPLANADTDFPCFERMVELLNSKKLIRIGNMEYD